MMNENVYLLHLLDVMNSPGCRGPKEQCLNAGKADHEEEEEEEEGGRKG